MQLSNEHADVSVQSLGAMLHDCVFRFQNGRQVRPLYDAPWRDDSGPEFDALPPIIQGLGSEWPCVPFARSSGRLPLPVDWDIDDAESWDEWAHGYAANHHWVLERQAAHHVTATITYPETAPVQRLTRSVRLLEDRPGLALSLIVEAREKTRFPLGLHPVLSMENARPGCLGLMVDDAVRVWSFPTDVEPGQNAFLPDQRNRALSNIKLCTGAQADLRALPPWGPSEDLLLLTHTGGSVGLSHPGLGCVTTVVWDSAQIPGCMLWISNGARSYYPWNSRVMALGIEPVAAAFDLGIAHSLSHDTPLAQHGYQSSITVHPDQPFICDYRILVTPIE